MVNVVWEFFLIVGDHDERLVLALAEGLDDIFDESAIVEIKSVERLVENEQSGVLDKCPRQEDKALLSRRKFEEGGLVVLPDTEDIHPEAANIHLFRLRLEVETDGVAQSRRHDFDGREVTEICPMHLR